MEVFQNSNGPPPSPLKPVLTRSPSSRQASRGSNPGTPQGPGTSLLSLPCITYLSMLSKLEGYMLEVYHRLSIQVLIQ